MAKPDELENYFSSLPQGEDDLDAHFAGIPQEGKGPVEQTRGVKRLEMIPEAFVTGVQNTIGLPGTIEAVGNKLLPDFMTRPVGSFFDPNMSKEPNKLFPSGEDIAKSTGFGLENRPDLKPEGLLEKFGTAAIEALPGAGTLAFGKLAAPALSTLGLTATAEAAKKGSMGFGKALATSEGGALAAEAATELSPNNPAFTLTAAVLGSIGGAGAVSSFLKRKENAAAITGYQKALQEVADAKEAARTGRLDVTDAIATARKATSAELQTARKLSDDLLATADEEVGKVYSATADHLGGSKTLEEAGKKLQEGASNWVKVIKPAKEAEAVKPLASAIPTNAQLQDGAIAGVFKQIDKKDLINKLDLSDTLYAKIKDHLENKTPLTWEDGRAFRTAVGDAMSSPKLSSAIGEKDLDRLYAATTKSLRSTAERYDAAPLFDEYNSIVSRLNKIQRGTMSEILNSKSSNRNTISSGESANAIIRAARKDSDAVRELQEEMPDSLKELASMQLRDQKAWNKLSPEARKTMLGDETIIGGLDSAEASRQAAKDMAAEIIAKTESRNAITVAEAADAARAARRGISDRSAASVKAEKEAVARIPTEPPLTMKDIVSKVAQVGGGFYAGNQLAPWVLDALKMDPHGMGAHALTLAGGLAVPALVKGAGSVIKNPNSLMIPATGVVQGQNALVPGRVEIVDVPGLRR